MSKLYAFLFLMFISTAALPGGPEDTIESTDWSLTTTGSGR